jgi:hypothetical protein
VSLTIDNATREAGDKSRNYHIGRSGSSVLENYFGRHPFDGPALGFTHPVIIIGK